MGLYVSAELSSWTHYFCTQGVKSTSSYVCRMLRISIKWGFLLLHAIGLPCVMDVWESHRDWSLEQSSAELLDCVREFVVCVENMCG